MNEISKREFFVSVLNAVGGRLQKSITYGDHLSDTKDNNVLKSCKSKEKKIEYIQSQLDLFTRFLEVEDVTIGHFAVEVAKDNITLSQENTFIQQHILKMCRAFIIDFFYDEFDEYVKSLSPDTDFGDINVCINFLPELCKDESKKDLITRFTYSMEQGLRKRRFDIKLDNLTTKEDYESKSEIYKKVVNNEVSKENESDNEYRISLNRLLAKYHNYHSKGNDNQDYQYVKNLGYIAPDGCSTKDNYCSGHMHGWIRLHMMRKIVLKNAPFNSYKEKIDFVVLHLELFQSIFMLNIKLNDDGEDVFTTLPETDEDALYLFEIGFKLRNDELTTLKNNGTKEIQAIPLKSFNELKDEVHKRIENSRDPKVLIENELLKLDVMFINEKRSNPGYYFKLEYDRQINVTEYKHNPQEWYMSSAIIEYIPIVKPYVDYYFYLKGILENETKVLNDKSFASSINNYKEDFFESYENLNEIEAQVCSNLASSFCSNIYIDLKYQEEYFSEQIPETNDRDFIIKFIESKAKGFKKIKNKCPEYLLNVCENYMLSLLKWEKDGVYTETDDSWFNVRNYFAHTFKEQICQLGIRFVSKEDVKKKTMDFWNDILDNKDSLIKFKKKTIGSLFEIVSQIKWNHTLLRIVKDYNNGVLSVDNYYCRIDLVEWGLIDYVDSDSKNGDDDTEIFIQDDSTEFEKKHFVSNGNKIENWNSPKSNEFLSDDDLKIVFDILDNLKITSENIYILGPRKKSSIRAVLDVLVSSSLIPSFSITKLCFFIGEKINANIKSLPENDTYTYRDYVKRANNLTEKVKN